MSDDHVKNSAGDRRLPLRGRALRGDRAHAAGGRLPLRANAGAPAAISSPRRRRCASISRSPTASPCIGISRPILARRGFCGICGSNLFWEAVGKPYISIMAGSLDKPTGLKLATAHLRRSCRRLLPNPR